MGMTTQNFGAFFKTSPHPDQATDFAQIQTSHFLPAIERGIEVAQTRLQAIKSQTAAPSFTNTVLAIESATEELEQVSGVFFNLLGALSDDEMQKLAKQISPKLAAYNSDLLLDAALFQRVKSVWDARDNSPALQGEERQLTEKVFKRFARNGALLSDDKKAQLRSLDQELSKLSPEFSDNVLKATNSFEMHLTEAAELEGLPESAIDAAAEAAKERGKTGWVFTLHQPSIAPFLAYAAKRELRQKLWHAYNARALDTNPALVLRIVQLRDQRARLLGYKTHAHFVLEERMAETPEQVASFLARLLQKVKPAAERDLAEVKAHKKQVTGDDSFMPWDYAYWSEKLKMKLHDLDDEQLRPYFKLENVIAGVFEHARRLYRIEFRERNDLPVYHPEVKTYEVVESGTNRHIGLFYADFFPRASKRSGAWMTSFREQGLFQHIADNKVLRPHVAIVCNFTKPTATQPSLLTLDEVKTLFHEFGHALHGLLSDCNYVTLAGTNVHWDFVELPSQIMENWVTEKESLALFAKHYETGAVMPDDLIEKIRKSSQFQAGYFALRQLNFAMLDLAWHTVDPTTIQDVVSFERSATAGSALFAPTEGTSTSTAFSHIFAGGYSAGYYSYKWAEVLDADAFEYFKAKGLFDQEVARAFRDHILSRGGTEPPMQLYKKFRGREPDPDALLRRDGLI